MPLLDRAAFLYHEIGRHWCRIATRLANRATYGLIRGLDRVGWPPRRRQAAEYRIDLDDLYRLDGHWALTFARVGTIHLPPDRLRDLGAWLDSVAYLATLWQSRATVGPATRTVQEPTAAPVPGRSIPVNDDYYGMSVSDAGIYHPYVMHPWVYAHGQHRRVESLRRHPRRFRLFFAGVVNDGYVGRFDFPILTRSAIVEFVLDTFRDDACIVTSRSDLRALRRTDRPIALVVFRGDITPMASNHYLTRTRYLGLLSRSACALCPPGVFMPHSHNLIEAMAVGTVPLLNYAEFCRPRLIDGRTCLAFSTLDDLSSTIRRALSLPLAEIDTLSRAVTRTYDEDLSPAGAARHLARWLAARQPDAPLILNREFAAARSWSRAHPKDATEPAPTATHRPDR